MSRILREIYKGHEIAVTETEISTATVGSTRNSMPKGLVGYVDGMPLGSKVPRTTAEAEKFMQDIKMAIDEGIIP